MKNTSNPEPATGKAGSTHTPGPWYMGEPFQHGEREMIGIGNGASHIGYVSITCCVRQSEAQANARLIASAPDLLQALKALVYRNEIMLGYALRGETETRWTHKQNISRPGEMATNGALTEALQQAKAALDKAQRGQHD